MTQFCTKKLTKKLLKYNIISKDFKKIKYRQKNSKNAVE